MRRRPHLPATVHIHADVLAHGRALDPHDALPTLDEWQQAFEDDNAERHEQEAALAPEPTEEEEISVRGIVQGESLDDAFAAPTLQPIVLDVASRPSGVQRE